MFFQGQQAVIGTITVAGGAVTAVAVTTKGTGYSSAPVITIADSGTGAGASVQGDFGRAVASISITAAGSYNSGATPSVSFTNAAGDTTGSGVAGNAVLGFEIASITLDTQGLGYRSLPNVSLTTSNPPTDDPTTPATVTPVLDEQTGRISSITLDSAGAGYETAPTIDIADGGGTGATVTVDIQSLTGNITSTGSGYTPGIYQNIAFTGGSGTSATATFTVPGFQGTITTAGSGYADSTGSGYSANFRNPPTTTYTMTVVDRSKLEYSGASGSGFQVGETVTGGTSNATGVVTVVTATYIYISNLSGTFQDSQVDTITGGTSNTTATLDTFTATVNRYLINGVEGQSLTLVDDNTYRIDTSDASNNNHPIGIGQPVTGFAGRQYRTAGTAGSYYELIVGPSVSSLSTDSYLVCTVHGQGMSEPGTITFTTGTAGQSGDQMAGTITVSGGQVTAVVLSNQGTNYKLNDVLTIDDDDLGGGGGSGFQYTLSSNSTGITSVTNISLTGDDYQIGDVLSVDDATVGGGGGSGFQYTCLLYTSPSPRDMRRSRMPSSA